MALEDEIGEIVNLLTEDSAFIKRVLAEFSYLRNIGLTPPAVNVAAEGAAIKAALVTARRNAQDAARKIRAAFEALIDA